jgi:hypothetical protein
MSARSLDVRPHLLLGATVLAAAVVAAIWWMTKPEPDEAMAADYCRAHYALAQDPADTAAVDLLHSYAGASIAQCGELRRRGLVN